MRGTASPLPSTAGGGEGWGGGVQKSPGTPMPSMARHYRFAPSPAPQAEGRVGERCFGNPRERSCRAWLGATASLPPLRRRRRGGWGGVLRKSTRTPSPSTVRRYRFAPSLPPQVEGRVGEGCFGNPRECSCRAWLGTTASLPPFHRRWRGELGKGASKIHGNAHAEHGSALPLPPPLRRRRRSGLGRGASKIHGNTLAEHGSALPLCPLPCAAGGGEGWGGVLQKSPGTPMPGMARRYLPFTARRSGTLRHAAGAVATSARASASAPDQRTPARCRPAA